jgi:hypothetical protein
MSLLDTASLIVTPNAYKEGKLYSVVPSNGSGDMSVVRATTAARVNSSSLIESVAINIPRLDYSNGSCPSLLVEPQRTNILLRSQEFDNATWTKTNTSVTANNTTSPDGTTNAEKLSATIATIVTPAEIIQSTSQLGSTTYSYSVYAKKSTSNFIALRHTAVLGNPYAWFNLNTGTIGTVQSGITASIESVGNGWYRCTIIGTTPIIVAVNRVDMIVSDNDANYVCAINGSIFIWGAQLEAGAYPTSYIPTTSAAVTRNADVISKTGISSLIGQTEGTLFIDIVFKNPLTSINRFMSITEAGWQADGSIRIEMNTSELTVDIVNNGSSIGAITYLGTFTPNTRYKIAVAYKQNDCQMYFNGINAGSDTSTGVMPACFQLYLNALGGGFNAPYEASNINVAALWKTRLTNAQLAQLTTI